MRRKIHALVAALLMVMAAHAQVSVVATIDSIQILIGQQAHVTLSVTADQHAAIVLPFDKVASQGYVPGKTYGEVLPGVELLGIGRADTTTVENSKITVSQVYTLTSFDENLYYLPPFEVSVNGKKYQSKSLAMKVLGIEVDTLHMDQFFGPKDVMDNPFLWSDWSLTFWLSVMLVLISCIGYYFYTRYRDNKPIIAKIRIITRLLPHQKAMKSIETLKVDGPSLSNDNQESLKEYYTRLTEILRKYIEERYGFSAMEMTSSEIIEHLVAAGDEKMLSELRTLFETADLVKFAKYSTLMNENDMNLVNAIEYINQTKQENLQTTETVRPVLSEEDKRNVKERKVLKFLVWLFGITAVTMLVYILWRIFKLLVL